MGGLDPNAGMSCGALGLTDCVGAGVDYVAGVHVVAGLDLIAGVDVVTWTVKLVWDASSDSSSTRTLFHEIYIWVSGGIL